MNVQRTVGARTKELSAGSWREKERALARLSRGETVHRAAFISETPKIV